DDDADLALEARGKPGSAAQVLPGVAAVHRSPEAASRASAREAPGRAQGLPESGVQDARVAPRDREVHRPHPLADEEHLFPRAAAVPRAVDAALAVRAEGVAERGDVDEIGVAGIHTHPADMTRIDEPAMGPRSPRVGGAVHAVAVRHVAADGALAHARV